jgi:hypothetical protein
MKTEVINTQIIANNINNSDAEKGQTLYKTAAFAALLMVVIIPIQIFIFLSYPPPTTVEGFFKLFNDNKILGLLEYDFLMIIDMILMIFIYLALYTALKKGNESIVTIGLILGLVAIAAFFASNTCLEMLSLSKQYTVASTQEQKTILLAAGQAVYEIYKGTAFAIYYELSAIALLLFTYAMFQSTIFSKKTAYVGLLAGIFMLVPPTPVLGKIGIVFSLISLIPWTVWLVLFAKRLLKIMV